MPDAVPVPTRDRLVRTAARLFLERSYGAVGVSEICTEAGLPKGSLYHWFASKEDLAIAVIDHHAATLSSLLDRYEFEAVGPVAKIRASARATDAIHRGLASRFGRVMGCPLGNIAAELAATDSPAGHHATVVLTRWERRLAGHCRDAASVGLLADGVRPADLARSLMATMQGMILMAKVSRSSPARIAPAMHRLIDLSTVATTQEHSTS